MWVCPVCEVEVTEITEKTIKHWCDNCEMYHSQLECYGEGDATNGAFGKPELLRLVQQMEAAGGWRELLTAFVRFRLLKGVL